MTQHILVLLNSDSWIGCPNAFNFKFLYLLRRDASTGGGKIIVCNYSDEWKKTKWVERERERERQKFMRK